MTVKAAWGRKMKKGAPTNKKALKQYIQPV